MATLFVNETFRLLRSYDPLEFIYPWYNIDFSPNLVTVTHGGLGAFTNEYVGNFTQAEDGTISGTVVGVTGFFYTDAIARDTKWPDLQFMAQGMAVEFDDFGAILAQDSTDLSPEARLLSEADRIYVSDQAAGYSFGPVRGYAGDDRIYGGYEVHDHLFGDDGNDELIGYGGDDTLVGGDGDDRLTASFGANRFEGGKGDDYINAEDRYFFYGTDPAEKEGVDTAVFSGDSGSYTIVLNRGFYETQTTIIDRVADRDGTDQLYGIEQLEFADRTIDWKMLTVPYTLSPEKIAELASLYIAYFDRAPDAMGLYFWMAAVEQGMTLEDVSAYFAKSTEALNDLDLNGSIEEMVTSVFSNVLNRDVDPDGLAFWTNMLEAGEISRDAFVLDVLRGVEAEPAPDEAAATSALRLVDNTYLDAKTNLGLYFSGVKGMSDVEDAMALFEGFDGSKDSVEAGKAMVDTFYADASDPESGELLVQFTGILDGLEYF